MIACTGVTKRFGALTAVDNISLEIERGQICTILGPNGAGKSTLISMLCGLLEPDAGEISVAGFDPRRHALSFRRSIGVVPDGLALLPELSIEEQLNLSGPIYGLDRRTTHERAAQILHVLGIYEKRHTYARDCSHGMRKKTALAMALLHNPRVLVLDEPFEGIDPISAEEIRQLLQNASERGLTILLTSHILSLVERVSNRLVLIRSGRIVWNSLMSELPANAETLYFELVESPVKDDLEWLRSQPS